MPVSVLVLVSRAASRLAARHEGELKHWQSLAPSRRGQAGLDDEIFYTGFLQEGIIQSGLQDGVIQCFSEAMAVLLLVELSWAMQHFTAWMRDSSTLRFLH
ncbi:unnamed protein product [Durusdinium trenchii]|uniref:Uncharacterized protein n=1 Tax=Durusdinium trenchii TaxID=1381693 RepID=A0ABP0R9S2_9DINO